MSTVRLWRKDEQKWKSSFLFSHNMILQAPWKYRVRRLRLYIFFSLQSQKNPLFRLVSLYANMSGASYLQGTKETTGRINEKKGKMLFKFHSLVSESKLQRRPWLVVLLLILLQSTKHDLTCSLLSVAGFATESHAILKMWTGPALKKICILALALLLSHKVFVNNLHYIFLFTTESHMTLKEWKGIGFYFCLQRTILACTFCVYCHNMGW